MSCRGCGKLGQENFGEPNAMIEPEQVAALIMITGLFLTGLGAFLAARAMWLSDQAAVEIGTPRSPGATVEETLKLPAVQNLLRQSRGASRGLWLIFVGTIFQAVGTIVPMVL